MKFKFILWAPLIYLFSLKSVAYFLIYLCTTFYLNQIKGIKDRQKTFIFIYMDNNICQEYIIFLYISLEFAKKIYLIPSHSIYFYNNLHYLSMYSYALLAILFPYKYEYSLTCDKDIVFLIIIQKPSINVTYR